MATASALQQDIANLEVRVQEAEAVLERREMEAVQQREAEEYKRRQQVDVSVYYMCMVYNCANSSPTAVLSTPGLLSMLYKWIHLIPIR